MNLPQDLKLRQDRLDALAVAKAKFTQRAAERWAQEKATGKKISGCQGSCRVQVVGQAFSGVQRHWVLVYRQVLPPK